MVSTACMSGMCACNHQKHRVMDEVLIVMYAVRELKKKEKNLCHLAVLRAVPGFTLSLGSTEVSRATERTGG